MNNTIRYPYHDENNKLLFTKVRSNAPSGETGKNFHWERKENDTTIFNTNGCKKVLYRLPHVLKGISTDMTIFLVEGEKDADTLLNDGLIATTTSSSLEWNEEFTQILKNADVVILYDNDKTGLKRRDLLCDKLYGCVKRLRVVDLPGIEYKESHGLDVTDWLAMGNTIEKLLDIVEKTPDYTPPFKQEILQQHTLRMVSIDEFFSLELPQRDLLLDPFLSTQGLAMIVAKRGVGKTHIALGIAYAVATGGTFLRWHAPASKKVLYIDGEMPASLMQERLQKIVAMSDQKHQEGFFNLITPDLQDKVMPDLSRKEGRDAIEPFVQDCDLVVLDNISCLFRSGGENESESWQEAQEWALDLRRRGKSVLFVHHAGKSGNQRGTSKKEDTLDAVIILKQPDDYQSEQGARFEVKFDKARHFSGNEARSFQVQLLEENGLWRWEMFDDPEDAMIEKVAEMRLTGHTIKSIVKNIDLTKSQVETLIAKAKVKGLPKK
jgi:hypothetical protein